MDGNDSEIYRLAMEAAPNPMLVVDGDGAIVLVNEAAEELVGYPESELVGETLELLVPTGSRAAHRRYREDFARQAQARRMGGLRDLRIVARDGSEIPVEIGLNPVRTSDGRFMVVCSIVDLSGRKEREEDLLERTLTDGLTSLRNRGAFMDHLSAQMEVAVRHARPLSVLILDIDHFKPYNDDFGHLAGDEVLRQVAEILEHVARRSDFVARIGGEEFGIILPETDREGARVLAERFREAIDKASWPLRPVTASIGATTVSFEQAVPRPDPPERSELLREADEALYRAKERGRNRVAHAAGEDRSSS